MTRPLSPVQQRVLRAVEQITADGWPASVREVQEAIGAASPGSTHELLVKLEQSGYLETNPRWASRRGGWKPRKGSYDRKTEAVTDGGGERRAGTPEGGDVHGRRGEAVPGLSLDGSGALRSDRLPASGQRARADLPGAETALLGLRSDVGPGGRAVSEDITPVSIMRVGLTTPCPVPVTPEGRTLDDNGEPLPMETRTQLCAVDAGWMIGAQRVCDLHLRELMEAGMISGSWEDLVRDAYGEYGEFYVEHALEQSRVPWSERKRYTQQEARDWASSAAEHGLG